MAGGCTASRCRRPASRSATRPTPRSATPPPDQPGRTPSLTSGCQGRRPAGSARLAGGAGGRRRGVGSVPAGQEAEGGGGAGGQRAVPVQVGRAHRGRTLCQVGVPRLRDGLAGGEGEVGRPTGDGPAAGPDGHLALGATPPLVNDRVRRGAGGRTGPGGRRGGGGRTGSGSHP